ncbi:hypothetical protein AUP07_0873 [methanogenic archaeon mixed culture ISO4-G1]|nr:hypothetical protein AUP07_0873 [methanogenic archaeon mixed culture ISO4-G1]
MAYEKDGRKERPRRDHGKDGGKKPYGGKPRKDFKGKLRGRPGDKAPRKDFGDRRPRRDSDRDHTRKPRETVREEKPVQQEPRKLLLPQDASRLLFRGIDCQVNGNDDLAMVMFLHGSVMMSEGCENNADRIIKSVGKDGVGEMRSRIAENCSDDALTEFDYLCITHFKDYDRTFLDRQFSEGTTHAIYRSICLEEVEGDDRIIDEFALRYKGNEEKVVAGLTVLSRKKDSEMADKHLARIKEAVELRKSVNVMFTRAMNGDARAVKELAKLSKQVPEAAFFSEYLKERMDGTHVEWLRAKYPQYRDLIISKQGEFRIQDTPFGMFLKAKSLEAKKEEWMSVMMNAAKAGSPEAMEELSSKMFRNDVRKCLASIYLKDEDLEGLLKVYDAGLDDQYYLDAYCGQDSERIILVGRELGKQTVGKEIDWLKDHSDKGMAFCRDELIERSKDERYKSKRMIYALHDTGADMEAAKLYFEMEGDVELPSVKWLKKVCTDESVKEFVRQHYESTADLATFDSIFADDGYERRPKLRGPARKGGRPFKGGSRPRR